MSDPIKKLLQKDADLLVNEAHEAWLQFTNSPDDGTRIIAALDELQKQLGISLPIALDIAKGKTKVSIQNG